MSRLPPQALDAEASLIGSILLDNSMADALFELPVESFYRESHRTLYAAIETLTNRGEPVDLVTLTEYLRQAQLLDHVGNVAYLIGLADSVPTAAHAEYYARAVLEAHRAREIIRISGTSIQKAFDGIPSEEILTEHETALTELSVSEGVERGPAEFLADAVEIFEGGGGVSTGFPDIDANGSLVKGGYNMICGRPSIGKSGLMRAIIRHRVAEGDKVCLFSIDQSGGAIYALTAAQMAGVSISDFRRDRYGRRKATDAQEERARAAAAGLRESWQDHLVIHDGIGDLNRILQVARREIRAGVTLIAIDHLQLVSVGGETDTTKAVAQVSRTLRGFARQFNITLLLLSQLNRNVEARPDKRPVLSDLRQSGAMEEDAEVIYGLYRDDYYAHQERRESTAPGVLEVIQLKHKMDGAGKRADLAWVGRYATAQSLSRTEPPAEEQGIYRGG